MNNIVIDPLAAHIEYKFRKSWSNDEKTKFVNAYSKYHKNFKKIAEQFQFKELKDIIEFYYQNKFELGLKRYDVISKKKKHYKKFIKIYNKDL